MNFLYGVLVITIAILALKTITKTVASLWRCLSALIRTGRRRRAMKDGVTAPPTEERAPHSAPDWQALSRELRQAILARGVRVSSQTRKLCHLDQAIEIEKREIELARLKAEKSQIKARHKSVRSAAQYDRKRHGSAPSAVPIAQLQAMREATRVNCDTSHKVTSGTADLSLSKRQTANRSSSLHH